MHNQNRWAKVSRKVFMFPFPTFHMFSYLEKINKWLTPTERVQENEQNGQLQASYSQLLFELQSLKVGRKTKRRMRRRYFANLNVLFLLTEIPTDIGNVEFFSVSCILSSDMHHSVQWQ